MVLGRVHNAIVSVHVLNDDPLLATHLLGFAPGGAPGMSLGSWLVAGVS